jgi:hypothetical protein
VVLVATDAVMSPWWRKVALAAHVMASVGWLGAVAAFLALAIVGLRNGDAESVRAAYIATDAITWLVIVPLAFGSLLTGILVSVTTPWGLVRHYWVLVKLILSVLATTLLLVHTRPIGMLATAAQSAALDGPGIGSMQVQLVVDATSAIAALLVNVVLSVFKPQGMTVYGWKKCRQERAV